MKLATFRQALDRPSRDDLAFTLANKRTAGLAPAECLPGAGEKDSCCGGSGCCR